MYETGFVVPKGMRLAILQYWMNTAVERIIAAGEKDGLKITIDDIMYERDGSNKFGIPCYVAYYEPLEERPPRGFTEEEWEYAKKHAIKNSGGEE